MKTLGLIGGLSWESTALYYRRLNALVRERLGGLHSAELLLFSFDFARIEALQAAGDWDAAAEEMAAAARRVAAAGADGVVICSNTMHLMADAVAEAAGLPLIHIGDATADALRARRAGRPLLLATRYTMEQDFYKGRLRSAHGLDVRVPEEADRAAVQRVIYEELCQGVVRAESKRRVQDLAAPYLEAGCDSVVFGCTEIGLLLGPDDLPAPVVDSTEAHCRAAAHWSLA